MLRLRSMLKSPFQKVTRKFSSDSRIVSEVDERNGKKIGKWLLGVATMVGTMVTVGGITRLTRSGLSMTDWTIHGGFPPMNDEEWEIEFARYKTFPEWQQRQSMTVEEFKSIYFWEYWHRQLGRLVGLAFVAPFTYFGVRKMIPKAVMPRLATLLSLGGAQGLIGWWMVKSGLEMDPKQRQEIRVSPYRLTAHLMMAFVTFGLLTKTGFDLVFPVNKAAEVASTMSKEVLQHAKKLRRFGYINGALVVGTVFSGAFVAGIDAGFAYNTFPKMGDEWLPSSAFDLKPVWKNLFENTALVQFDHRTLALTTLSSIALMYTSARRGLKGAFWKSLPKQTKHAFDVVMGMAMTQVGLGISTLLMYVPVPLAAAHQTGSVLLLATVTFLLSTLRFAALGRNLGVGVMGAATLGTAAAAASSNSQEK